MITIFYCKDNSKRAVKFNVPLCRRYMSEILLIRRKTEVMQRKDGNRIKTMTIINFNFITV